MNMSRIKNGARTNMESFPIPEKVTSLLGALRSPVPLSEVHKWATVLDDATDSIVRLCSAVRPHELRSQPACGMALEAIMHDPLEEMLARLQGVMDADAEAQPFSDSEDEEGMLKASANTAIYLVFTAACLDLLTRNSVSRVAALSPNPQTRAAGIRLVELHGRWVEPVRQAVVAVCLESEMPLAATVAAERPLSRGRKHFELARAAPQRSQAFLRSLSGAQRTIILQALRPHERAELDALIDDARSQDPAHNADRNLNDTAHTSLLVHPSFDRDMLKAASSEQVELLGGDPTWGAVLKAAMADVRAPPKQSVSSGASRLPGESLWSHVESGANPLARALRLDGLTGHQLVMMLSVADEARIHKMQGWMGFPSPRPEVIRLLKSAASIMNDESGVERHGLEANAAGHRFLRQATSEFVRRDDSDGFKQDDHEEYTEFSGPPLSSVCLPDQLSLLDTIMTEGSTVGDVVQSWTGHDTKRRAHAMLEILRRFPLFKA